MNPSALPEGTAIRVSYPDHAGASIELERTSDGWAEVGYHCVDCAADWTYKPEGLVSTGDAHSASKVGDLDAILEREGTWEVVSVSAAWLRDELTGLLDSLDDHVTPENVHTALRDLAIDAGLS